MWIEKTTTKTEDHEDGEGEIRVGRQFQYPDAYLNENGYKNEILNK